MEKNKVGRPCGTKNKKKHGAGRPKLAVKKLKRNKTFSIRLTDREYDKLAEKLDESQGKTIVEKFLHLINKKA